MDSDATTGRTPFARLSDCEQYLRRETASGIKTVVNTEDEEKFRVVNEDPDLEAEVFDTIVFDAAQRFNLDVRETDADDVLFVAVPGA